MSIKIIEYNGISGYARVMYNEVKEADKYHIEVTYSGKDVKALLEYLFELEERNERLNNIINKTSKKLEMTLNCIKDYMVENEEYIKIHTDYIYALEEQIKKLKGVDKE